MSATKESTAHFHAVADHFALAMLTDRRDGLNSALKAVKRMPRPSHD